MTPQTFYEQLEAFGIVLTDKQKNSLSAILIF